MRSLSRRAARGLTAVCALFALMMIAVAAVGIFGVRSTTSVDRATVSDELATASATAHVGRLMDTAYAQGLQVDLAPHGVRAADIQRALSNTTLPSVEAALTRLVNLHADDGPAEKAEIRQFGEQWAAVRALLVAPAVARGQASRAAALDAAYAPLSTHIDVLLTRETSDAKDDQRHAAGTSTSTQLTLLAALAVIIFASAAVAAAGRRLIRRAVQPESEQVEFAEALQVADAEAEAHDLLKAHLERAIPGSQATILNRNNSADRLEAMTPLQPGSCLSETLKHANPRSCLAVRAGAAHTRDADGERLLHCQVCGDCPGRTMCMPFTVGGEVIGAVLVNQMSPARAGDEERVQESVTQAAPVLANLRNLAIAEVRAATDSLTGLPNKRAVADTVKRMLAQASRTLMPLSVLMIDLDHFKDINDRHGHPVGDQALADVGAALASALRTSDFAGRNGGEEFTVLLPDTDIEGALSTAEKIRAAIAEIKLPGVDAALTASLGIAVYPDHATSAERLERLADAALYTAKRAGRNRVEVAQPESANLPGVSKETSTSH